MFRRLTLVSMTAASLAFSLLAAISSPRSVHSSMPFSDRHALHFRFADGRFRLLWTDADRPVRYTWIGNEFRVTTRDGVESARLFFAPTASLSQPNRNNPKGVPAIRWRWIQQWPSPGVSTVAISYVRTPVWLPPILLLAYPAFALLRRLTARKVALEGYCPQCGYDLTGNLSGLCPECGSLVAGRRD